MARGLAGGSAAVVAKGEVAAFRLAVREALDQEAEELARDGRVTAFSGGGRERLRGRPEGWLEPR